MIKSDPVFAGITGDPGIGKSTDLLYSFPTGIFVADPGALRPAGHVVGYEPKIVQANTLTDLTAIVQKAGASGEHDSIIIDDFSMLVDRHIRKEGTGKFWSSVYDAMFKFREAARKSGMHVILNSHLKPPKTDEKGERTKGGMALPGDLAFNLQAAMDMLLRGVMHPARKPWGLMYRTDGQSPDYVQKCRFGTPDNVPGNMGEILRSAGLNVKRLPELEWQEGVVESLAGALGKTDGNVANLKPHLDEAWNAIEKKYSDNQLHIRWTIRDALDRSIIRRARAVSVKGGFGL